LIYAHPVDGGDDDGDVPRGNGEKGNAEVLPPLTCT
jgi:hypothetical protein